MSHRLLQLWNQRPRLGIPFPIRIKQRQRPRRRLPDAKDAAAADPRRADSCVRFAETRGSPAGDATITNTCAFPVEVTLCYKGARGGPYDCPAPPKGKRAESLRPGATLVLPEYRRARHAGVALVACRGALGSVFPRLDDAGAGTGCH